MKQGAIVSVRFWDHVLGSDELIECEAVGRVVKLSNKSITLEYWSILNEDAETCRDNQERMSIARGTIIETIEYGPKKAKRFY